MIIAALSLTLLCPAVSAQQSASPPAEPPPTRVGLLFQPNHVSLRVRDLERSMAWWRDVFGAQLVRRSRVGNIDPQAEIAFMHISGGFHIELVGSGNVRQAAPAPKDIKADYELEGWKHVGFMVADMDRVIAHLRSKGVEVAYDTTRPDYGVRIVLIKEPNGYFIELYAPLA